jgi:hypothetical protein
MAIGFEKHGGLLIDADSFDVLHVAGSQYPRHENDQAAHAVASHEVGVRECRIRKKAVRNDHLKLKRIGGSEGGSEVRSRGWVFLRGIDVFSLH